VGVLAAVLGFLAFLIPGAIAVFGQNEADFWTTRRDRVKPNGR
jgi:hypothetical protein